jgi:hypothetical protein
VPTDPVCATVPSHIAAVRHIEPDGAALVPRLLTRMGTHGRVPRKEWT